MWSGKGTMEAQTPRIMAGWISQCVYCVTLLVPTAWIPKLRAELDTVAAACPAGVAPAVVVCCPHIPSLAGPCTAAACQSHWC